MVTTENKLKAARPWLFWFREYLHRACDHHGCDPVFNNNWMISSDDILRKFENREEPVVDFEFMGTFNPMYYFRAAMPYVLHRNAHDLPQDVLLEPIYKKWGFDSNLPGNLDPIAIDYSKGVDRAMQEVEALYLLNNGRYEDAVTLLLVMEYKKTPRDIIFDIPRAVGLWLFDKTVTIERNEAMVPCNVAKAVGELKDSYDEHKLWLDNKELSDFHFYLNKTIDCVQSGTVLPFSKRKSKK